MSTFLWIIAIIMLYLFLRFFLIPYLLVKIGLWYFYFKIKRRAKKYPGEEGDKLKQIATDLREIIKEEKL